MTKDKLISVGKGALVAAVGAALTYLSTAVTGVDFGSLTPVVVAAYSVAANYIRKWLEKEQEVSNG